MAYKDSLFRTLFGNEEAALGLYNALHGTESSGEVAINTLGESLLSSQKNDISFLLGGKLVVMVEQESLSTINLNMPFRFLQPIGRILENGISDKKAKVPKGPD